MTEDSNHRTSTSENFIIAADCVFISYSRKDKDFANKLVKSLREWSVPVWIDTTDIPPGDQWEKTIHKALQTCQIMIVIVSPDSAESRHVMAEYQSFVNQDKPIIPVMLYQTAKTSFLLDLYQRIYFAGRDYEIALKDLLASLEKKHNERVGNSRIEEQSQIQILGNVSLEIKENIPCSVTMMPRKIHLFPYILGGIVIIILVGLLSVSAFSQGNFLLFPIPTPAPLPSATPIPTPFPTITPTPLQYCEIDGWQIRRANGEEHRISDIQAVWQIRSNEIIHIQAVVGGCEFDGSLYQWQSLSGTITTVRDGSIMYRAPENAVNDEITLIMPLNDGDKEAILLIIVAKD